MDSIVYRQQCAAAPMTGKTFLAALSGMFFRLAAAQVLISLLVRITGLGLLNIALYLYAVWLIYGCMYRTVARYVYTFKTGSIVLERCLGDSAISGTQIPLERIVAMRPVRRGERLKTTYSRVDVVGSACRPALRVRVGFALSLISMRLARFCAGKGLQDTIGYVLVFDEEEQRRACVFAPDEKMIGLLAKRLGDVFGFDERMTRARVRSLYGRALERAFPALYPYVEPLVSDESLRRAFRELDAQDAKFYAAIRKLAGRKRAPQQTKKTDNIQEGAQQDQTVRRRRKQG